MTTTAEKPKTLSGAITVSVRRPDGEQVVRCLSDGDSLVVGSSSGCGLQLEGDEIAGIHCMIGVSFGEVWVRDCYSGSGTYVDGKRISEVRVDDRAEVRVGSYRLALQRGEAASEAAKPSLGAASETPVALPENFRSESFPPLSDPPSGLVSETQALMEVAHLREELSEALSEISRLRDQLAQAQSLQASEAARVPSPSLDVFQEEALELLRAEVTQLQAELADRDTRLAELTELADQHHDSTSGEEEVGDTTALVDRLEQLLDELERKDQREAMLQELLRVAEEANRAEQEERHQLEAWVSGIEQRLADRESEWEATVEKLTARIEELTAERDRAEQALREAAGAHASDGQQRLVERLQNQLTEHRQQILRLEQERDELQRREVAVSRSGAEEGEAQYTDDQLQQQRLELAQERAELARQRAELEKAKQHLEQQREQSGSEERLAVLRQHLRETHEQESRERKERSLPARIARLWKRIENRPN